MNYRVSAKALIFNEDESAILMCQEDNGKWEFPGGGVDHGETLGESITRELQEEMGITPQSISDKVEHVLIDKFEGTENFFVHLYVKTIPKHLNFTPSSECCAIRFFPLNQPFLEPTFPSTIKFFEVYGK